jgi:acyl-CoA synthetase (AMP-forming)/AMP-acid ligase II
METIFEILSAGDAKTPAVLAPGHAPLTFAQLHDTVLRLAGQLRSLGIGSNDRLALVLPNGPEMAITFLAVASCATAAPLNPRYRKDEFAFYTKDLGAKALITLAGDAGEAHAAVPRGLMRLSLTGEGCDVNLSYADSILTDERAELSRADDVALVLHTSGTTSRPKIVPLRQRNLAASAQNIGKSLALTPSDRCLNMMPLFHIHGLVAGLLAPLAAGGSTTCTPSFDGFRFFDWLDELRPTWYTAVPTMHQMILGRARRYSEVIQRAPLRFVRSSSAALPTAVLQEIDRVFGVPMIEAYGMTEATHQMASNPLPPGERKPGSMGHSTGIEIAIMSEDGRLMQPGERGEVVIKGETVITEYENNPEANSQGFVNGWFRTGDQGYLDDDSYLFLTGRLKEIINRGGEKISPLEIDEVLLGHPAISQAVSFALPHDKLGEEVAAAVVLTQGGSVTERQIQAYAAEHLAQFKVPKKILLLDDLPKGPTGKLQRIGMAQRLGLT